MKKFEEYTYKRPELDEVKARFHEALNQLKKAEGLPHQVEAIEKINQVRMEVDTMENLVYIRHSIDTNDDFYKAEQDYMDELSPEVHGLVTEFYHVLLESPYRKELEKKWGGQLFSLAESEIRTFSPEIIPLLQKENKLSSEYTKLMASAKIPFKGEERTLAQMGPFSQSNLLTGRPGSRRQQPQHLSLKRTEVNWTGSLMIW